MDQLRRVNAELQADAKQLAERLQADVENAKKKAAADLSAEKAAAAVALAAALQAALAALPVTVEVVALKSQIGSGSLPVDRLPSAGFAIRPQGIMGRG